MRFTLDDVAAASAARAEGTASLSGVAVDSRQARPGDLFVAIPGARVDGHDYAADAVSRGARALLAER
ncbi:MAG TPA: Mur ligase domain-containing protein, partial [Thermoanaerobaculia bacterium]|nr:Mur ligase domain-containing protein [Thermoanaerobaculia bacterium]